MESPETHIRTILKISLEKLSLPETEFALKHPTNPSHGDYSTNLAFLLAKKTQKSPLELAKMIVEKTASTSFVGKIEVAEPGFINFHLSRSFFSQSLENILKEGKQFGYGNALRDKAVLVEYTQPNPFKEFHIGHLVNNVVGEAISRIIESQGARVFRVTYHGDVGLHVAKTLWGIQKLGLNSFSIADLGKAYAIGDAAYAGSSESKEEIVLINKKIYEQSDPKLKALYEEGKNISLKHFVDLYQRLGSKFDHSFFESGAGPRGVELVRQGMGEGIFKKSDGAVIFPEEVSGLHTRVFITSEGFPTYEAKDLGLFSLKQERFSFDESITLTDIEQAEYFKVVMKAMTFVFPETAARVRHISHGRLRLSGGRMSSRTGNIISGETLLDELQKKALKKMANRNIENKVKTADKVAVAALKYSILKQSPERNIIFDMERSLSFEGDSGPYLQYSFVRARSILEKADEQKISPSSGHAPEEPLLLERMLYRFPEVVTTAQKDYAPQQIAGYLVGLAGIFNGFYSSQTVVDVDDPYSPYYVSLTQAFEHVLKNGLYFLGVRTVSSM